MVVHPQFRESPPPRFAGLTREPRWLGALMAAVLATGCPDADSGEGSDSTDGGGDDGGDDGELPVLPGHRIQCCQLAQVELSAGVGGGTAVVEVCEQDVGYGYKCIDPSAYDADGDGDLEFLGEMQTFCDAKCTWTGMLYKEDFPWQPLPDSPTYPNNEDDWANASQVYGCQAIPQTTLIDKNVCNPDSPNRSVGTIRNGSPAEVPPTNDFSADTADAGNSVDLEINGNTVSVDATLEAHFGLYDCDASGVDGGTCSIAFSALDLSLGMTLASGDYDVLDASLRLAQTDEATVSFAPCQHGRCEGTFSFSDSGGNPIGVDLLWTQENTTSGQVDEAGLNLSNAAGSLGGLDRVRGTLVLDEGAPTEGSLRIQGSGRDAFGGSFAEIDIDLTGTVSRL